MIICLLPYVIFLLEDHDFFSLKKSGCYREICQTFHCYTDLKPPNKVAYDDLLQEKD